MRFFISLIFLYPFIEKRNRNRWSSFSYSRRKKRHNSKSNKDKGENKKSNISNPPKKDRNAKNKRNSTNEENDVSYVKKNNNYLETMDVEEEINIPKRKSKLSITSQDKLSKTVTQIFSLKYLNN